MNIKSIGIDGVMNIEMTEDEYRIIPNNYKPEPVVIIGYSVVDINTTNDQEYLGAGVTSKISIELTKLWASFADFDFDNLKGRKVKVTIEVDDE